MNNEGQADLFLELDVGATSSEVESFGGWFEAITHFPPFRWQARLFERLLRGEIPPALDLPTGLGKTSVMTLWLLARAFNPKLPRRLVYVVDRRAVVDQATREAEKLKDAVAALPDLAERLGLQSQPLPVSTLRGKLADNREWLADPTLSAIIVGTIDMTGSRLLFEGYGVSRGMRPYHAGLLGADALFVLDEAHLCPPFQALLAAVEKRADLKARDDEARTLIPKFHLLPLSATGRSVAGEAFRLDPADSGDETVAKRLTAKKSLAIEEAKDTTTMLAELVSRALELGGINNRVLVFCDRREDAKKVAEGLRKVLKSSYGKNVELMTGARRVFEREALAKNMETAGFIAGSKHRLTGPAYLVATSAGEVGIDLDADHMVCDLVAFERMVQRLGRVNRRGEGNARIDVIAAPVSKEKPAESKERIARLRAPLDALRELESGRGDANPGAFVALKEAAAEDPALAAAIQAATSAAPLHPELTRAVVDAWSMTSLEEHTGRPEIEPWLRGWIDKDEPEATVIWREHLPWRKGEDQPVAKEVEIFFDAAPPHLSETLEALAREVRDMFIDRAKKIVKAAETPKTPATPETEPALDPKDPAVLLLDRSGKPKPIPYGKPPRIGLTARDLAQLDDNGKKALLTAMAGSYVIVHRQFGGMNINGLLEKSADSVEKTLDHGWPQDDLKLVVGYRVRLAEAAGTENDASGWHAIYSFQTSNSEDEEGKPPILVEVYRGKDAPNRQGDPAVSKAEQGLQEHLTETGQEADALARALSLPDDYRDMLVKAAEAHDLGKDRVRWQDAMNAPKTGRPFAKTQGGGNPRLLCGYRHEFGSLADVENSPDIKNLPDELKELALHLIASHHGYARPIIAPNDPNAPPSALAKRAEECALRYARLQRRWGPWGLAWWEAIFRAADQRASRKLDERADQEKK
jgi:CRISPR-associated endonuclease/helicase Cas3